jgi:hypothetical protein
VTFTNVTTNTPAFITGTELVLGASTTLDTGAPFSAAVTSGSSGTLEFTNVSGFSFVGGTKLIYGILYEAKLMPNRMEIQLRDGSAQMRKWRIARMAFRLYNTKLAHCFETTANAYLKANEIDMTDADPYGGPISSTGYTTGQTVPQPFNFDWHRGQFFIVGSKHPVPCNILAVLMEVEIEGTAGAGGT